LTIKAGLPAKRILLTGGRAPVALEWARLLRQAGHRVFAAESAPYYLCRVSNAVERSYPVPAPATGGGAFLDALERIVKDERIDVILPTCEEIFHVAKGVARLARHCRVWTEPLDRLHDLHHKGRFIACAERFGLTVPRTLLVESAAQGLALGDRSDGLPDRLVLKPAYSRFASHVRLIDRSQPLEAWQHVLEAAAGRVSPDAPWVAQAYIEGSHYCSYSVAYEGRVVAHAVYPSVYRYGRGATVHFETIRHDGIRAWVSTFVQRAGFTGQIAFDFIEDGDGVPYAIECNPRTTSGIHLFAPDDRLELALLEPERLAAANAVIEPQPGASAMLAMPMLLCGLRSLGSGAETRAWLAAFRRSSDIVYRRHDPEPAWEQLRTAYEVWRVSRRMKLTLSEATTYDIEWNGER